MFNFFLQYTTKNSLLEWYFHVYECYLTPPIFIEFYDTKLYPHHIIFREKVIINNMEIALSNIVLLYSILLGY